MLTSAEEVKRWGKLQEEVVIVVSTYLASIKTFVEKCGANPAHADDMAAVYQLHRLVQNFDSVWLVRSLQELKLESYYHAFNNPRHKFEMDITNQTIPSHRQPSDNFVRMICAGVDLISEFVIAIAKVPPPIFSITLAAGTPFAAYLLVSRLVESATQYIFIADAYLDASIFDRYLYRVKGGVRVSLRTNPSNWNGRRKEQFEEVERLYFAQHPEYDRADRNDLHARYLITETGAWRIDGSIKDIAAAKDCPIHTIHSEERDRVIKELFS